MPARNRNDFADEKTVFFDTGLSDDFVCQLRHYQKLGKSRIKREEKSLSRFISVLEGTGIYTAPEVVEEVQDTLDIIRRRPHANGLDEITELWRDVLALAEDSVYPIDENDPLPAFCISMSRQESDSRAMHKKSYRAYRKRFRRFRKDGNLVGYALDSSLATGKGSAIVTCGTRIGEVLSRSFGFLASPELDNRGFLEKMREAPVTVYRQTANGYKESVSTARIDGISDFSRYWKDRGYVFRVLEKAQDIMDARGLT